MEKLDPKENLKVFDTMPDEENRLQNFIMANVIYIIKDDSVLMLTHTKDNSATGGKYIGVGGKLAMKSFYGYEAEKIPTKEMITSIMMGKMSTEDALIGACREIEEETGLFVKPEDLQTIGFSHVKKKNVKSNEIWNIVSYIVEDYKGEIDIEKLNENSKEGVFELVKLKDIPKAKMWPADKVIFNNRKKKSNIYVEAIYDENGGGTMRYVMNNGRRENEYSTTYILINDLLKPEEYLGEELTVEADSLKDCDVINMWMQKPNSDIDKLMDIMELRTVSCLPNIRSKDRKFEFPEHSALVKIDETTSMDDICV